MESLPPSIREATSEIVSSPSFDWNIVPDYLKKYVAVFLRYSDILALCDSSKRVREEICEDDFFWKMKTKHDFGVEYDYPPWPRENWEEDYRYYMRKMVRRLERAIITRNAPRVRDLIDFGVDVDSRSGGLFPGEDTWVFLMQAVREGDYEIVKLLLDAGAYVNAKTTENRFSALHFATWWGMIDIVRLLIDYGADVTAKDAYGGEAIVSASLNSDSLELVDLLLEEGSDINNIGRFGRALLINAARRRDSEYIQGLIDRGAEVNYRTSIGLTPLFQTIYGKNPEALRVLLDNGVDIAVRNHRGSTALDLVNAPGYATLRPVEALQVRRMIREAFGIS